MRHKLLLFIIISMAFVLRFWGLGTYPALNADEASNTYDAYSLILTGMDQHGHPWPITFQSFNDYKPGLYVYLDAPFVRLFGLNVWAARIPGVVLGVLSVVALYLLVVELFRDRTLGTISALFLAISPWHIHFSRGGWEVNIATFFIIFGTYLLLVFIRTKNFGHLIFGICNLALSMYAYHAARITTPLLCISLALIYRKGIFLKSSTRNLIIGGILGLLIILPLVRDLMNPGALSRAAGVGLFADHGPINRINEQRGEHQTLDGLLPKLLHNKIINYSLAFGSNYLAHFNGEFMFMSGDSIERNKVPETVELYLFDMLFLLVGFIFIFRNLSINHKQSLLEYRKQSLDSGVGKPYSFILTWLLVAPLASALTFQSPNALRSQNMVVPLVIISSLGFLELVKSFNLKHLKIGYWLLVIGIVWCFTRYLNMYYIHMGKVYPYSSQYGLSELVNYLSENDLKYDNVFVTARYDQPYSLFLFYLKYPPQKFQFHHTLTLRDEFGFSTVSNFDKYHFGPIDFSAMQHDFPNSLIIGTPAEIPQTANLIKRIYGTNGFEYFDIVQN